MAEDPASWAVKILGDSFDRINGLVVSVTDGLTGPAARFRPDDAANSIGWLLWHLSRVEDSHVAEAAGKEQVWSAEGWFDRFALPFPVAATGYGQSAAEVAAVDVAPSLLADYHAAVHAATLRYLQGLTTGELDRVVDENWDPPVTVAVRLVSVLGDCWQHAGQAAYLKGLASRTGFAPDDENS